MNEITMRSSRRFGPWTRAAILGLVTVTAAAGATGIRAYALASGPAAPPAVPTPTPRDIAAALPRSQSYSAVVDKVAPAVVTIRVQKHAEATAASMPEPFRDFFGQQGGRELPRHREGGLGSGVIIREDGLVLTNHHVVEGADTIRVDVADGRTFAATLVGSDPPSDLAVLRIATKGLPTLPFGDSDRMKVGDVVLAFGNPLGVGQTVTMGIVSAKSRATGVSNGAYEDFLQTDAPINQGNSGGALVNLQGELVGINAQIVSPSGGNIGLGFAIPSGMAQTVADQLTRDGVVHRAKLGVTVQGLTPELAETLEVPDARGALVSEVEPGGPADRAGVKQGDVVTQVDGKVVKDANAMRNQIAGTRPGSSVPLVVRRNGHDVTLTASVIERERVASADRHSAGAEGPNESGFGMALTPLTPQIAQQLDLPRGASGLVVAEVDPAGLAASAGMRPGDLITSVNGQAVASVSSLRAALKLRLDRPALVLVSRNGAETFVALPRAES